MIDSLGILQNIIIPETDDAEAERLQFAGALGVILFLDGMLTAIDFYDQRLVDAYEIGDVWADRMLATEFEALERTVSKAAPEFAFGIRR